MLFHKHLEDLLATVAAELEFAFRRGKCEDFLAKGEAAEVTELCGGIHLVLDAEGFDMGDDPPTVHDINGCCKGWLPAVRNAVAYLFEKRTL